MAILGFVGWLGAGVPLALAGCAALAVATRIGRHADTPALRPVRVRAGRR